MTFEAQESSVEGGQPVEVYRFVVGADEYRYTSGPSAETVDALVYQPLALSRGQLLQSPEDQDGIVEMEVPGDNAFARLYINIVPPRPASIVVQRFHRTDTPTPEAVGIFQGFVSAVKFSKDGRVATIVARPHLAVANRTLQRFEYQVGCGNVLYDEFCQVDETDPTFRAANYTVSAVSGSTITVPGLASGYAAGWFVGGWVEVLSPNDLRLIIAQSGDVLTLLMPFHGDVLGETVNVNAGCAHNVTDCTTKFSNYGNYGGEPYIPLIDPNVSGVG